MKLSCVQCKQVYDPEEADDFDRCLDCQRDPFDGYPPEPSCACTNWYGLGHPVLEPGFDFVDTEEGLGVWSYTCERHRDGGFDRSLYSKEARARLSTGITVEAEALGDYQGSEGGQSYDPDEGDCL